MTSEHPNDLDLELARTGEAEPEILSHVEACASCQRRTELFDRLSAGLAMESVDIPPARDAAILALAGSRAEVHPVRRRRWLWAVPAAAAAAVLIAIWPFAASEVTLGAAPDVNADGRVDIVDAMLLARALEREQRSDWDANGDSHVDDRDVETIALAAVSLEGRGW